LLLAFLVRDAPEAGVKFVPSKLETKAQPIETARDLERRGSTQKHARA